MRYLRVLALVGICLASASYAHAQRVVIGFGVGPTYVGSAPDCVYGYYGYSPYSCAPYGYYGPEWFSEGYFVGAGPWFRGSYGRSGYYDRHNFRPDFDDREHEYRERGEFRGQYGYRGNEGGGFRGEGNYRGGNFRGYNGDRGHDYRGGDGFHGGESRGNGRFRGEESHSGGGRDYHGGGGFGGHESRGEGGFHGRDSHDGGRR